MKEKIKWLYRCIHPKYQKLFLEYSVTFKPRYGYGLPPHKLLYELINKDRNSYMEFLTYCLSFKEKFWEIKDKSSQKDSSLPVWNNGFLPGLDIITLYCMIAYNKPSIYLEVGSGNSTKVARKAIQDLNLSTKIISIDPHPRAEIDHLADEIIRKPFEDCSLDYFSSLNANDIIFIDNSHRILPNSDAMVFFLEVLPQLSKGIIVQIHDIYLPYDYPQIMCDRFYSEQYGLAMYLLANPHRYKTILPNYFISEDKVLSSIIEPIWLHHNLKNVERHGGSYWIKIYE